MPGTKAPVGIEPQILEMRESNTWLCVSAHVHTLSVKQGLGADSTEENMPQVFTGCCSYA